MPATKTEEKIIADLTKGYARLSGEAQADFAKSISWSERHMWWIVLAVGVLGIMAGHFG